MSGTEDQESPKDKRFQERCPGSVLAADDRECNAVRRAVRRAPPREGCCARFCCLFSSTRPCGLLASRRTEVTSSAWPFSRRRRCRMLATCRRGTCWRRLARFRAHLRAEFGRCRVIHSWSTQYPTMQCCLFHLATLFSTPITPSQSPSRWMSSPVRSICALPQKRACERGLRADGWEQPQALVRHPGVANAFLVAESTRHTIWLFRLSTAQPRTVFARCNCCAHGCNCSARRWRSRQPLRVVSGISAQSTSSQSRQEWPFRVRTSSSLSPMVC